jgi:hypothetical protein
MDTDESLVQILNWRESLKPQPDGTLVPIFEMPDGCQRQIRVCFPGFVSDPNSPFTPNDWRMDFTPFTEKIQFGRAGFDVVCKAIDTQRSEIIALKEHYQDLPDSVR